MLIIGDSWAMSQSFGRLNKVISKGFWLALNFLGLCTLLAFFSCHFWITDLIANQRVQLVLVGLSGLLVGLFLRQWILSLRMCFVRTLQLSWFATEFPPVYKSESVRHVVTVTSVNVLCGNVQYDNAIADLIEVSPDVFAV